MEKVNGVGGPSIGIGSGSSSTIGRPGTNNGGGDGSGKRKEIYKYEAPWTVYSMNWSVRPDKRFRLALGKTSTIFHLIVMYSMSFSNYD